MRTIIGSLIIGAVAGSAGAVVTPPPVAGLDVTSTAFTANTDIPSQYTCEGANISPPLAWSTPPADTQSIALQVFDPDAPNGGFVHWLVSGIPGTTTSLAAGETLPGGAMVGINGNGASSYAGPCPPTGKHHYIFTVYALDIAVAAQVTKPQLHSIIDGHVLAQGRLIGLYEKQGP